MTNDGNPCRLQGNERTDFYSRQQLKTASGYLDLSFLG
jgi:hypothetical protein